MLLLELASSFHVFRSGLRTWTARASDTDACIDMNNPVLADGDVAFDDARVPILAYMEELRSRGWSTTTGLVIHRVDSKAYSTSRLRGAKNY